MPEMKPGETECPFDSLHCAIVFSPMDWGIDKRSAWIYGIVVGWEDEGGNDAEIMVELARRFHWSIETIERLRRLRAAFKKAKQLAGRS